ncbi:MAG: hypothetical protein KIT22_02840 [Verrucomicrobiae bacterium]|nr:hypothetical protein [Verrucomicrobiae bacterium]
MRAREEWQSEQDRLLASYEKVREELARIPGVVEVGVGLRRRGGRLVEEAVYVVTVKEKRPESEIPDAERIPSTIHGVPTDVVVQREPKLLLGFGDEDDSKNYKTKVGGISIGAEDAGGTGTLGCFCKQNSDGSTVLLSNHHVLFHGDAKVGSGVGQPRHESSCCCTCNEIGKVLKGDKNLDCAIASLNTDVPFFPKIRRIKKADGTVEEEGLIKGTADPVLNQVVWKVGKRTGLTRGKISMISPETEIAVDPAFDRFAYYGDSGSVVVDKATGNVVALLYAITDDTGDTGLAKKITAVEAVMSIKVLVSDPAATYSERMSDEDEEAEAFVLPPASPLEALVETLRESEAGRELLQRFDRHREECLDLLKQRRGFTVAWHRNQGPAWLAALGRSARDPNYRVPEEIEGVSFPAALRHIGEALRREASEPLRRDLDEFWAPLTEATASARTVGAMIRELESQEWQLVSS